MFRPIKEMVINLRRRGLGFKNMTYKWTGSRKDWNLAKTGECETDSCGRPFFSKGCFGFVYVVPERSFSWNSPLSNISIIKILEILVLTACPYELLVPFLNLNGWIGEFRFPYCLLSVCIKQTKKDQYRLKLKFHLMSAGNVTKDKAANNDSYPAFYRTL